MTPESPWPEYTPMEWARLGRHIEDVHQGILAIRQDVSALIEEAQAMITMGYTPESIGYGTLLQWHDVADSYAALYPLRHRQLTDTDVADDEGRVLQLCQLFLSDIRYIEDIPLSCYRDWRTRIEARLESRVRGGRDVLERCWGRRDIAVEALRSYRRQIHLFM